MNLRKVTAGQPMRIAAEAWNTLVDTATDYQARVNFKGSVLSADRNDFGIALVKNTTAADCRQYGILGIDPDTVILDPDTSEREFRQRVVLAGVTPADEHKDCFCILTEPIKAGKLGRAMLVGVTQCWVDMKNESDTCAAPESDNADNLVSTSSGIARILWKQAGTGVKVAIVRLGGGGGRTSFIGRVKQDSHTENHCIVHPCLGTDEKARDVAYPEVDTSEDAEVDNVLLGGMGLDNIFVQCDPVADLGDSYVWQATPLDIPMARVKQGTHADNVCTVNLVGYGDRSESATQAGGLVYNATEIPGVLLRSTVDLSGFLVYLGPCFDGVHNFQAWLCDPADALPSGSCV